MKEFIIISWISLSVFFGLWITINDLNYNFFSELKWRIKKLNIFGKVISYLFFIPYIASYIIICILIKAMTWHPNKKS